MTDKFKQDNLDLIESVGKWDIPCLLPMKRYVEERARWEEAVLRYVEASDTYVWHEGVSLMEIRTAPSGHVVTAHQIKQLVDDGWMVN